MAAITIAAAAAAAAAEEKAAAQPFCLPSAIMDGEGRFPLR